MREVALLSTLGLAHGANRSLRVRLRWLPSGLRFVALGALALGLLDLHIDRRQETTVAKGLNIVLLVDASRSMLAQDFEPDRLGAAKRLAEEFANRRDRDRFALITFAGDAVLDCPLTMDRRVLTDSLRAVSTIDRRDGTSLGGALAGAVARLKPVPETGRVVIVLTDGASNAVTPTPHTAAGLAAAYGVRIYTIGIGATGLVPYPTEFGRVSVSLDLDEAILQDVSRATGGTYFRAADAQSLEAAFSELDRLEPTEYVVPGGVRHVSLSPLFAVLAVTMLLLEQFLAATYVRALAS